MSLLVLVTLIWGNSFIVIKHIVEYVTPLGLYNPSPRACSPARLSSSAASG